MIGAKYRLGERIGAGGMAEIFRAHVVGTQGFERAVAVKRVRADKAANRRCADMFVREARILAGLRHPNVVAVSDFARDDQGRPFLVMELVDGVDLGRLVRTGPVPLPVAVYLAGELLRGLGYMHDYTDAGGKPLGLVHRDVSTGNVLLSWDGAVKISDFGLAKAYADAGAGGDDGGNGTPCYMSPEQVQGGIIDRRTDLFAAGVILYELLTGTLPFAGDTWGLHMLAILRHPVTPPRALRPEIPADLEAITMHLLERERARRPDSAAAVLEALDRCAAASHLGRKQLVALLRERFPAAGAQVDRGAEADRDTDVDRGARAPRRTAPVPAQDQAPAPRPVRRARSRRALAAGLVLVLGGLGGATGTLLLQHDAGPARQANATQAAPRTDGIRATMPVTDTNMPRETSHAPIPAPPETIPIEQASTSPARVRHGAALRPSQDGNAYPYFATSEAER